MLHHRIAGMVFWMVFFPVFATWPQSHDTLSLEQIFAEYRFYPESIEEEYPMADGDHYALLEGNRFVVSYDYLTGTERKVLFAVENYANKGMAEINDFEISADGKKILLTTEKSQIYRHSYEAKYYVYDVQQRTLQLLCEKGKQQLASISPDGTKAAFVMSNNLYVKDLKTNSLIQVTFDGQRNMIINGAPDWVYEEEFSISRGYYWSVDGKKIAYYRFDESRVREYDMILYNGLYPETYRYKYPKAGEDNSVVSIHVYDTETGKTSIMDTGAETDQYIPRIKWTASPEVLCVIRMNRLQNKVDVTLCNASSGKSETVYSERNERFISEISDNFIQFTPDMNYFIVLSERSGYFHYYQYSITGKYINAITEGDWDVDELLGIDASNRLMYYTSSEESPLRRNIYSVGLNGKDKTRLSEGAGTFSAKFSSNFHFFICEWSDANTPPKYVVYNRKGKQIRVLKDNAGIILEMKRFGFTRKEFLTIPLDDGLVLYAFMIKPPDFDSTKKYPILISVYGGPESQDVTDAWDYNLDWYQYLAQHGIIVACIDNRGTDARGEAFRKCTYLQLGKLETEDQIHAVKYLLRNTWIDEKRIGIYGASYGGYMTLLCLMKGADVFKLGIALAPVTDWRYYDTIYTERFMRKPGENPTGYKDNSPMNLVAGLKGKLLLIHGTADDNVHFQNTMELADKLIKENKQFSMFVYPDRNHNISGGNTRYHRYRMMADFILGNL
jgi:dipeptidyl-peptidase-4